MHLSFINKFEFYCFEYNIWEAELFFFLWKFQQ